MTRDIPVDAITVVAKLPPQDKEVLGWIADEAVAICGFQCVVRRTSSGEWGGPGCPATGLSFEAVDGR